MTQSQKQNQNQARPLVVVLGAGLVVAVVLLALAHYEATVAYSGGGTSGVVSGRCPAPVMTALRQGDAAVGVWAVDVGEKLFYVPGEDEAAAPRTTPADLPLPQSPCRGPARHRLAGAAGLLLLLTLLPGFSPRRRRGRRSAMMTP